MVEEAMVVTVRWVAKRFGAERWVRKRWGAKRWVRTAGCEAMGANRSEPPWITELQALINAHKLTLIV
ncbi:Protein of unknown function [Gryllus bimaculatus]|nr:Protein of unknown function [Gryllus bimaculatus]